MIDARRVYFTFPDATLSYECRGCGACCRGLGVGFDAASGELDRLLGLHPEMASFVRRQGATWTAINPRGRCWFLDDGGRCRVEDEHGRDAKPATCRLFPFNRVFRLGGWTVVDFNSVVCPLRAPSPDAPDDAVGLSGRVAHAEVLAELSGIADGGLIGAAAPPPGLDPDALVEAERDVARQCFEQARRVADAPQEAPDALQAALRAQGVEASAAPSQAVEALLGRPWRPPGTETARAALLLTPSMRFNELFGPRRWADGPTTRALLGKIWWVWLDALADAEALAGRALGLQEATGLWSAQVGLGWLLARWNEPAALPSGPLELGTDGEVRELAMGLARALHANARAARPLGALVTRALDGAPPHMRVAALRALEPQWPRLEFGKRTPRRR